MLTRRDLLQVAAAASVLAGARPSRAAGPARPLSQSDLLAFDPVGQVTLLHFTDCHAQLVPLFFREPSVNLGVGEVSGLAPHITGAAFLESFGIKADSPAAYALTDQDFVDLARSLGRIGGLDRMATLVKAIRAERPGKVLLLDGGDTWQGSYTSYQSQGGDMVEAMNALGVDAMTAHWEFTYGEDRVMELKEKLAFPFLAGNVVDTEWQEDVFDGTATFERGGVKIAVIGQAFPYTPIANPRYKIPQWSFGVRDEKMQERVDQARADGAALVVVVSHNGFDVDRKMAGRVSGIDVLLTGHTHDALPQVERVGNTLLVASGSHGKFLSRLDISVKDRAIANFRYQLIPIFSDVIAPDPEMAALVARLRQPHAAELGRVLGRTEGLLYRRGNFNGTFDDMICDALLEQRDAEIALSPGFRWGCTLLPGQDITVEDVHNVTSITYPAAYRTEMTGARLKEVLEDVADNLFNPDPYYQQGGDMVRVGGLAYSIAPRAGIGSRIGDLVTTRNGAPIDPARTYTVAGWASVNEGTDGPPIWDVVERHIVAKGVIAPVVRETVRIRSS
ncbi:MAG: thiosulfohydrolase SoxB [Azospirillum sp.]|nr:thiosulfohydrolase SoxB [Azospirillum sp.]